MAVAVEKLAYHAVERALELVGGTVDRLMHRACMVRDRARWTSFEARFHRAAFVLAARLVAIFVADVDLDARDVRAHMAQGLLDDVLDVVGEAFV